MEELWLEFPEKKCVKKEIMKYATMEEEINIQGLAMISP